MNTFCLQWEVREVSQREKDQRTKPPCTNVVKGQKTTLLAFLNYIS